MQALIGTARNIRHSLDENENVHPEIEAVLTTLVKGAEFVGSGIVATENLNTIRFSMTPSACRQLAKHAAAWADEAEKEASMLQQERKKCTP